MLVHMMLTTMFDGIFAIKVGVVKLVDELGVRLSVGVGVGLGVWLSVAVGLGLGVCVGLVVGIDGHRWTGCWAGL